MNFIVENWMLLAVALASGGMLLAPMLRAGGAGLSVADAVQLINRQKGVLIDVRDAAEYAAGHAAAARHIPLAELQARLPSAVKNKALPLVMVCASGARAQLAVQTAQKLGYANAQALAGGMKSWREANLPVQRDAA